METVWLLPLFFWYTEHCSCSNYFNNNVICLVPFQSVYTNKKYHEKSIIIIIKRSLIILNETMEHFRGHPLLYKSTDILRTWNGFKSHKRQGRVKQNLYSNTFLVRIFCYFETYDVQYSSHSTRRLCTIPAYLSTWSNKGFLK